MPIFRKGATFEAALKIGSDPMHISAKVGDPMLLDNAQWAWLSKKSNAYVAPNAYFQMLVPPFQVEFGEISGTHFAAKRALSEQEFYDGMQQLGWDFLALVVDIQSAKAKVALISESSQKVEFVDPAIVYLDGGYNEAAVREVRAQVEQHRSLSHTGKGRGMGKKGKGKGRVRDPDNKGLDEIAPGDILRFNVGKNKIVAVVYKTQKKQGDLLPHLLTVTSASDGAATKNVFYFLVIDWPKGKGYLVLSSKRPLKKLSGDNSETHKNVGEITNFSDTGSVATIPSPEKSILFRRGTKVPPGFFQSEQESDSEEESDSQMSDSGSEDELEAKPKKREKREKASARYRNKQKKTKKTKNESDSEMSDSGSEEELEEKPKKREKAPKLASARDRNKQKKTKETKNAKTKTKKTKKTKTKKTKKTKSKSKKTKRINSMF